MKSYKYLNLKGVTLDKEQLQNYMEKIAVNYEIDMKSDVETYPINRLMDNYNFIQITYNTLNEHIKNNIGIYPAGEWLLDNFYIIEETVKNIKNDLTKKKYKNFPGISTGIYKGFARIYVLASEIISYTDSKVDEETLNFKLISI